MCQHIVVLAERNGQQYISQCEHGTVHLIWDGIGLHLPVEAFNRLATHILKTRANIQEQGESVSHGHVRMCVGKMSLTLPVEDFLHLVEMVDEVVPDIGLTGNGKYNSQLRLAPPQKLTPPFLN